MKSLKKLNGWWRLFVVLSIMWFAAVLLIGYTLRPTDEMASLDPAITSEMEARLRDRLVLDDVSEVAIEAELPNGHLLKFRDHFTREDMIEVAKDYIASARSVQDRRLKEFLIASCSVALCPPVLVAVLGIAVAWIRRGFVGERGA